MEPDTRSITEAQERLASRFAADLRERIDAAVVELLFKQVSSVPEVLWHYTKRDVPALLLAAPNLRLSHYRDLNDTLEVDHFFQIARAEYADEASAVTPPPRGEGWIINSRTARSVLIHHLFEVAEELDRRTDRDPYIMSFSVLDDDIQQWRSYAENGHGVSIAFNVPELASLIARRPGLRGSTSQLLPVVYDDKAKVAVARCILEAATSSLCTELAAGDDDERALALFSAAELSVWAAWRYYGVMFKHKGFRSEQEWRAVVYGPRPPCEGSSQLGEGVRYGSSTRGFVFVGVGRSQTGSVRPGPLCDVAALLRTMSPILGEAGAEQILLPRSTIPYRP